MPKLFADRVGVFRLVYYSTHNSEQFDIRLRNVLYCVGWGVKLYSLSSLTAYVGLQYNTAATQCNPNMAATVTTVK